MSKALVVLFQKFFDTDIVPNDWKVVDVAAMFKKDDRKLPSNYRPISWTPVICKVLESVKLLEIKYLITYFEIIYQQMNSMALCQGTPVLTPLQFWTESLEKNVSVDVI